MPTILFKRLKVDEQRKTTAGHNAPPPEDPPETVTTDCIKHGRTLSNDCVEQAIGENGPGSD